MWEWYRIYSNLIKSPNKQNYDLMEYKFWILDMWKSFNYFIFQSLYQENRRDHRWKQNVLLHRKTGFTAVDIVDSLWMHEKGHYFSQKNEKKNRNCGIRTFGYEKVNRWVLFSTNIKGFFIRQVLDRGCNPPSRPRTSLCMEQEQRAFEIYRPGSRPGRFEQVWGEVNAGMKLFKQINYIHNSYFWDFEIVYH